MQGDEVAKESVGQSPTKKQISRWVVLGVAVLILVVVAISATFLANEEVGDDTVSLETTFTPTRPEETTDSILIGWKSSATTNSRQSEIASLKRNENLDRVPDQVLERMNITKVRIPPVLLEESTQDEVVETLRSRYLARSNSAVDFIEADRRVDSAFNPNDPWFTPYNPSINLINNAQFYLEAQYAQQAWDTARGVTGGGNAVKIAVLDTGVYCAHPDLVSSCLSGWNVASNSPDTNDNAGHGTVVAGTASATSNNALGVASIGFGTKIIPVKITDQSGYATYSTIASGIVWAADNGADVINVSWGDLWTSNAVINAASYARQQNIITVTSAGNNCSQTNGSNAASLLVVAAWSTNGISMAGNPCSALYPVEKERRTSFSSYGSQVDFSAGHSSFTTGPSGYGSIAGTSIAAPYVAGTIALMLSVNPELSADNIEQILKETALDWEAPGWDRDFGWGRVDTGQAVTRTHNTLNNLNISPPTATAATFTATTTGFRTTVNLSWSESTDDKQVTGYKIYRNSIPIATVTNGTSFVTYADNLVAWNPSTTPPGQNAGTYYFIRAFDAANNFSQPSNTMFVLPQTGGDTTPPTVSLTSPTNNATVSGVVELTAQASDNVGVTRVDFLVNGVVVASDTSSPYSQPWDTSLLPNGQYTIQAKAYDASNNVGASGLIAVNLNNNQTQSLTINSVGISGKTATSANVVTVTNIASEITVYYGTSNTSLNQTATGTGSSQEHVVPLTGLTPRTTYYYKVTVSANGQSVTSPIYSFRTKNR